MEEEVNEALIESNELLQEEVTRVRSCNRMLRRVISALRQTNAVLRTQVGIAVANDEAFKAMCDETIGDPVAETEGGLPELSDVVEPAD